MGCATSLVKYLVFIINFLFALAGLAMLIVGILILKEINDYDTFLDGKFHAPPILMIVVGSLIFLVSFFGCCGAVRESHCMLVTYVVLLLTIFIIQVVVAGLAFAYRDDTKDLIGEKLEKFVNNYHTNKDYKQTVDTIQSNLKCCGYTSYHIYVEKGIPESCCKSSKPCSRDSDDFFSNGCKPALEDFIAKSGNIIGGIAIGVATVEIVGIIFGLCLANSVKNEQRRGR